MPELFKQLDVALFAAAFANLVEDEAHLAQALATGRALSAAFLAQEIDVVARDFDHAAAIVHDDHAAGAHHGAIFNQRVEVNRQIEQAFGDAAARRAARLDGLEGTVLDDATADIVDEGAKRGAHGDFNEACMLDLAHHGENLRTLRFLRPQLGVFLPTVGQDGGNGRQGLDVVQHRRLLEQAALDAADILGPRLAHLALDRIHKCRGLAAHEGAAAAHDVQVQLVVAAHDALAQDAGSVGVVDSALDMLARQRVLVADVEHTRLGADGQRADDHALDNGMGAALHRGAVHERARVALVAVAHDVLRPRVVACRTAPLTPRGEAGAALAAQTALLHFGDDLVRRHGQRPREPLITAGGLVLVQAQRIDDAHIFQHHLVLEAVEGVVRLMFMVFSLFIAIQKLRHRVALE